MTGESLLREAKSLLASGEAGESIDFFNKSMAEGCNPVTVYLNRGVAYITLGKFQEAVADFTSVLELDNDNDRALYFRGVGRLNLGRFAEAVADLDLAIAGNKGRGAAFLARGMALAELGREEEAVRDFKTAALRSGEQVGAFLNQFGGDRTMFGKSMALLAGERGPWKYNMTPEEADKIGEWRH